MSALWFANFSMMEISGSCVAHEGSLVKLLDALPISILGILLVLAGHELALTGVRGVVIVGTGKTHVGALCAGW